MTLSREINYHQNFHEVGQVLDGIAFIDSGLEDYQSLVAGVAPGIEVVVLDSRQDGVEQISRALAERQRVSSVHIVSHGASGAIYIGDRELSLETLNHYGNELLSWADWLAPNAELLIYGCEVAKGDRGQAFIHCLSELTGASVHASTIRVGNGDLETNWRLDTTIPVANGQSPSQVEPRLAFCKEVTETYSGIFMATFKWSGGGTTNNWTEAANWLLVSGTGSDADGIPDADDVASFDGTSTKNATINGNVSIQNLQVAAAYTGSLSLGSNTLAVSGGLAIANASSFDSGTGTVRFTGNQTVDSTAALYNLEVATPTGSLTLVKDLVVNNDLTITDVNQIVGSGGTFNIKVTGDVITNDANFSNTNSAIQLVGSTDQSISGTGVLVNLDVAKTGGDVLLTDDLRLRGGTLSGSGLLKNAGGKVIFGEPNNFLNDSYTSNFTGSIDDVELKFHSGSNFILSKDLVVNNDLTITEIGAITGSGGTFNIKVTGDVITNDANFSNTNSAIQLVSSTDQSISGTGVLVNLDVAKTGGDVLLTDDLRLRGGTLSGSGLLKNAGGKVIFGEPNNFLNDSYTSNFTGSIDDVELKFHSGSNFILSKDLVVNNDLTITQVGAITSSGFSIKVAGDVISSDANGFGGTGAITLVGSATNTFTGLGSGTQGNLAIDKATSTDKALLGSNETFSSVVVNEGIFDVNGKTATAGTTINSGGTLGGSGTVIGNVTVNSGGVLAPGSGIGILNTRSVNFTNGSLFNVELGGTSAGNGAGFYDQLNVTGTVTIGTSAVLNTSLFGGFTPGGGNTFIIVNNDGVDAINGKFNGLAQGATVNLGSGINATISYAAGDGNDIGLSLLNQAPNLTGNGTLAAVAEDTTNPNGQTISTLFNGLFSDPDAGASLGGVAVVGNTANTTTQGTWQYSTDGTNWFAVGTVADGATALALSASTVVRFVPVANYNGDPPALTVRALDNTYSSGFTSGGTRINLNTGTNGGTTAISGSTNIINTSITAVNDAPTGSPTTTLATGTEDTPYTISKADLLAGFSDVDGDSLLLSNVTANGTVLTADSSGNYTFTPAANFNGTVNLSYNVVDGKGGSVAATQSFAITPVNDAPTGSVTISGNPTQGAILTANNTLSDVDGLGTISYQWQAGGTNIAGATSSTFTLGQNQVGKVITVTAAYTDGQGTAESVTSAATSAVASALELATTPGSGNYVENNSGVVIDPTLFLNGTNTLTGATVSIGTNFNTSQDRLLFNNQLGISGSYNTTTGILSLSGTASIADYQTALRSVRYFNTSDAPTTSDRSITFSIAPASFNAANGHFYEFVSAPGISWTNARTAAAGRTILGIQGYLATVTSVQENSFIAGKLQGQRAWIGASDAATESVWRWVTGPEGLENNGQGRIFSNGSTPANGQYFNWVAGQPDNFGGTEHYAHFWINNAWNDIFNTNTDQAGYVVEYGGLAGDPVLQPTGNRTLTVTAVNDAPVLSTNTLSITEGGTVTLSVANLSTTDPDTTGAGLTYTVSNVTGGRFELIANQDVAITSFTHEDINTGKVRFVHDGGEAAPSYNVSVSDGIAPATTPAVVSIGSFTKVNDAPTGTPTATLAAGTEDTPYTITQTALLQGFTDPDSDSLSVANLTATKGTLVNNNNGTYTFTPNANFDGTVNLSYNVVDGKGGSVAATQSFAITPVNDAPVLATNTLSITEGGTVTFSSSNLNSSDLDNTPAQLIYTISNISGGSFSGTGVTTNGNGTVSFTQAAINNGLVQFTHDGGENPPSYAVSVSDGALNTTPATVTIPEGSFTPINDAPTGTPTATLAAGTEDTVYTISQSALLQGFTDVEGNTLSVADLTASNGTLVNNNNGTYTFTPAANFNGTINLSYNVVDGNGGSVTATQSFAIAVVNDAPVLATNVLSITEGATVILSSTNLNTTDSDTPATELTYIASNVTGGQFESVGTPGTAITSFTQDDINNGLVQFVHNGGEAAPSYSVSINDGKLSTPATPVSLGSFTSVNDAPTLATNTLSITEGATVIFSSANLNVTDSDTPATELTYIASNVTGGQFESVGIPGTAITSFTQDDINNGLVQFVHNGGENPPSYAVSVSDGELSTTPATVTIPAGSFTPVNDAPTVAEQGIEDQITSVNQAFSLNVSNKFTDVDQGEILTYSATGLPTGFSINANTGILSGTISSPGIFNVNVTADDGDGGTVSDAFELIVANNNATPFNDIIYMSQLSGIHKDKVNAKEGRDRVIGTSANEFLGGAEDDDYLDGQGGNDKLLGGDGNDTLIGRLGSDDLQGGDGNDILTGWGSGTGSANQMDELKGGNGADTYILGESTSVFYNLGGYNDYAKIVGFEAEDRIQLKGTASNYSLGSVPSSVSTDKASIGIFTNSGTELIAVLKNEDLNSTSLTTDARFIFV
ncbi:cadherin-like domain-containing protein [Coleofasciculus sp. FACHB-712]|nr:cadherin-like domain-containing protein [Coleofasciculus sp. FACHB-712]